MAKVQITLNHRLEPLCTEGDPGQGLAATVHDPLWLLGRQLQFGELTGEDAGSPVALAIDLVSAPVTGWRRSPADPVQPIDVARDVVDASITGERPGAQLSRRDRLDAGRRLRWLLPAADAAALAARFPIAEAPATEGPTLDPRWIARYPDGVAAAQAVAATRAAGGTTAELAAALGVDGTVVAGREAALAGFVRWCTTTYGLGPDVWVPELMERQFELVAPEAGVTLRAVGHTREATDWHDLDVVEGDVDAGVAAPSPSASPLVRVPSPIRFPGMPCDRFWAFEDERLAMHATDVAANDLARLALVEFSTVYGNDWFTVPVPVRAGTLTTARQVVLTDSFGRRFVIAPAVTRDGPWALHALSAPEGGARPWLLVPAATTGALAGPVVEEVAFTRDEMANLVWGVEKLVTADDGSVRDRVAEAAAARQAVARMPSDAELLYRLMTEVPTHWVPFVPVHVGDDARRVGLVEAVLPRPGDDGEPAVVQPLSAVLRELAVPHVLHEEEVPPSGIVLRRQWWLARSPSGRRVTWAARTASAGRGEGSSGLAFDGAVAPGERR